MKGNLHYFKTSTIFIDWSNNERCKVFALISWEKDNTVHEIYDTTTVTEILFSRNIIITSVTLFSCLQYESIYWQYEGICSGYVVGYWTYSNCLGQSAIIYYTKFIQQVSCNTFKFHDISHKSKNQFTVIFSYEDTYMYGLKKLAEGRGIEFKEYYLFKIQNNMKHRCRGSPKQK